MNDYAVSQITKEKYYINDVIRIVNPKQCMLYIKNGLCPVDIYVSQDTRDNSDILVMLFNRAESQPLYEKWKNHILK